MTNKELSIILRLRDEASKQLEGFRGNLQRFANAWRRNWLAITAAVTASIFYRQGYLPNAGTWLDQPAKLLDVFDVIERELGEMKNYLNS